MNSKLLWLGTITPLLVACQSVGKAPEVGASAPPSQDLDNTGATVVDPIANQRSAPTDALMAQFIDDASGVLMVIQEGEIAFQQVQGWADIEQNIPITTETIFHLGSVGKQFTAMGILLLVERGQVKLDAPISTYIPELSWMDDGVTIRRLLHHTSGVMGYDDDDDIYDALLALSPTPDNEDVLTAIAASPAMLSAPGEAFSYSNTGYDLLGLLIERISGQSYSRFMTDNLFAPLGMSNTFALPSERRFRAPVAQSYDADGAYAPDVLDQVNGSGSIYSNLGDLYLYDQALDTDTLVSPALLAEMFTSGTLNNGQETGYGFGFDLATYAGYDYAGHSGAWLGFDAYYLRFPQARLSIVVLLNWDDADPNAAEMAFAIADLYLR